jgi:hypothetical protein
MNIEFVEARLPSRRAWIAAAVILVLGVAGVVASCTLESMVRQERTEQAAARRAAAARAAAGSAAPVALPPYFADARAALARARLPEAEALSELEAVAVTGIQLRSIDVNGAEGSVVVELEAASDDALSEYLDQLNAGLARPAWRIQRLASSAKPANAAQPSGHIVYLSRMLGSGGDGDGASVKN